MGVDRDQLGLVNICLLFAFRLGTDVAIEDGMQTTPLAAAQYDRVVATLPFVESLARRMASTMPHSIDLGDLVQNGVLGLIDAANRFDEARGIKFETFAERRVRGAMIDALRRDAWPRGVRRVRRELEAAREQLRRELGGEPTLADLAKRVGVEVGRLERTIVRINTIESTSAIANVEAIDQSTLPAVLVPSEPLSPHESYVQSELRARMRAAMRAIPSRERRIITMYYFEEATMKQIGEAIGVNESRVSQLHARAIARLRKAVGMGADAFFEPSRTAAATAIAKAPAKKAAAAARTTRLSLVRRGRDLAA